MNIHLSETAVRESLKIAKDKVGDVPPSTTAESSGRKNRNAPASSGAPPAVEESSDEAIERSKDWSMERK